jgi:hypothetical protein
MLVRKKKNEHQQFLVWSCRLLVWSGACKGWVNMPWFFRTSSPVRFQYERQARLLVHGIPLASATYGGGPPWFTASAPSRQHGRSIPATDASAAAEADKAALHPPQQPPLHRRPGPSTFPHPGADRWRGANGRSSSSEASAAAVDGGVIPGTRIRCPGLFFLELVEAHVLLQSFGTRC